jgi:hypothetical protein
MILIYQITVIKKAEIRNDTNSYFDGFKSEYFYYVDQFNQMKHNNMNELVNLASIENSLDDVNFCEVLSNYTDNIPNCSSILGGINKKGYNVMLDTIYNNLFFLYDDLKNNLESGFVNITHVNTNSIYLGLLENYKSVIYNLNFLFVENIISFSDEQIYNLKFSMLIIYILLIFVIIFLFCFYLALNKNLKTKRKVMNNMERYIVNSISSSL